MLSKNEVKYIQSLGHKKQRQEEKVFIAEGPKIVSELLTLMPKQFEKLYATEDWVKQNAPSIGKVAVQTVSEIELSKISGLTTPNEVLAVIRQFEGKRPADFSFALYLDAVQDPGNLGTIIRIADWFGVSDIVCTVGCAELYNPKVVQSTMASIARVNVFYDEDKSWLSDQSCAVLAATLNGVAMNQITSTGKQVLIIGNESKGISDEVLKYATQQVTIPKAGQAESLNAAVATGILLSHLVKL